MTIPSVPTSPAPLNRRGAGSRALRWTVSAGTAVMVAVALVLLFLLTQATSNHKFYERNYERLFVLNIVVAGLLLAVILWVAYKLATRFRQGRFGSRLLVKLAVIFALAGFAPGMLIYVVSYQFVSRSIESWFDVKVEGALDAGLSLGRVTLDAMASDLASKSRILAAQLAENQSASSALTLDRSREQLGLSDLALWSASGQLVYSVGESRFDLSPDRPSPQQFRNARNARGTTWIEGIDDAVAGSPASARIKALVPVPSNVVGLTREASFLAVTQTLPTTLVANALAVTQVYREYQERALAREGLRRMYIGTLTLSLFLAVFGAVLLAVLFGNQIAQPLLLLADGVSQVAAGDLTPKAFLQGKDELGGLTRSFADMTQQLSDARQAVHNSMEQVNSARVNLQTILDNLTAGVIVLDANGAILSSNPGATRILRVPLAVLEGHRLTDIDGLTEFGKGVQSQFERFLGAQTEHGVDHWQESFELGGVPGSAAHHAVQSGKLTLVARGAQMPGDARLLVFDDISEIVSAQRSLAWGEVARRLAHEIKNPLTPIQLSAERLELKLMPRLESADKALLSKAVKTIVDQVDAMKRLVNEFRDYARLPAAELKPLDLNALVVEVMNLYESDSGGGVAVRQELDCECPQIKGDAQQLRQVIHNLVQNAQDAMSSNHAGDSATAVVVRTQWSASTRRVRLSVIDQGVGFAEHILKRAFEPYVTTKSKGTGLGLAVVKKIADEHGTRVDLGNRVVNGEIIGAQVSLSFAVDSGDT